MIEPIDGKARRAKVLRRWDEAGIPQPRDVTGGQPKIDWWFVVPVVISVSVLMLIISEVMGA